MNALVRLADSRWLQATPPDFRRAVLDAVRVRTVAQGAWLYGVGDEVSGPVAVISGALAYDLPAGQTARGSARYVEWPIQPGHWIGVAAPIMGVDRQANLRALVASDVAELSSKALRRLVEADPQTWRHLGVAVVQNSHVSIEVAAILMLRRTEARVAAMLLRLSQSGYVAPAPRCSVPLPQEDIARLCALTRPVLSRQLAAFEARGLVRTGYRQVEVTDAASLAVLAE